MAPRGLRTTFIETIYKKKEGGGVRENSLAVYSGKTIAVDFTNLLYKFRQRSKHKDGYLLEFINFIHKFKRYDINLVFVFDGKPCEEKQNTIEKRKAIREDGLKKLEELIETRANEANEANEFIEQKIQKLKVKSSKIYYNNIVQCKKLFTLLGVKFIHLPSGESDSVFKYLCDNNIVDACYSNDMDLVIYGCKIVLSDLDFLKDVVFEFNYEKILDSLNLTRSQFVDSCILSGTDYNSCLTNSRVSNNIDLIKKYNTIENVISNLNEINSTVCEPSKEMQLPESFNYKFVREIYNNNILIDKNIDSKISEAINSKCIATVNYNDFITSINRLIKYLYDIEQTNKYINKLKHFCYLEYKISI
jgi:5'-3' exonuclease